MTNAEKFQEIFKKFATEVWAFPEKDFLTWLNAEYKEPTTKNDLVPRNVVERIIKSPRTKEQMLLVLNSLPSQEPRKGHWIMTSDYLTTAYGSIDYVKCSCCGEDSLEEGDYCPNCGAEMSEVDNGNDD